MWALFKCDWLMDDGIVETLNAFAPLQTLPQAVTEANLLARIDPTAFRAEYIPATYPTLDALDDEEKDAAEEAIEAEYGERTKTLTRTQREQQEALEKKGLDLDGFVYDEGDGTAPLPLSVLKHFCLSFGSVNHTGRRATDFDAEGTEDMGEDLEDDGAADMDAETKVKQALRRQGPYYLLEEDSSAEEATSTSVLQRVRELPDAPDSQEFEKMELVVDCNDEDPKGAKLLQLVGAILLKRKSIKEVSFNYDGEDMDPLLTFANELFADVGLVSPERVRAIEAKVWEDQDEMVGEVEMFGESLRNTYKWQTNLGRLLPYQAAHGLVESMRKALEWLIKEQVDALKEKEETEGGDEENEDDDDKKEEEGEEEEEEEKRGDKGKIRKKKTVNAMAKSAKKEKTAKERAKEKEEKLLAKAKSKVMSAVLESQICADMSGLYDEDMFGEFTLLHIAAYFGKLNVLKLLLDEMGGIDVIASVDVECFDNSTPLRMAVNEGHLAVVYYLLSKDASLLGAAIQNPGWQNNYVLAAGFQSVHIAANNGNVSMLAALLQHAREQPLPKKEEDGEEVAGEEKSQPSLKKDKRRGGKEKTTDREEKGHPLVAALLQSVTGPCAPNLPLPRAKVHEVTEYDYENKECGERLTVVHILAKAIGEDTKRLVRLQQKGAESSIGDSLPVVKKRLGNSVAALKMVLAQNEVNVNARSGPGMKPEDYVSDEQLRSFICMNTPLHVMNTYTSSDEGSKMSSSSSSSSSTSSSSPSPSPSSSSSSSSLPTVTAVSLLLRSPRPANVMTSNNRFQLALQTIASLPVQQCNNVFQSFVFHQCGGRNAHWVCKRKNVPAGVSDRIVEYTLLFALAQQMEEAVTVETNRNNLAYMTLAYSAKAVKTNRNNVAYMALAYNANAEGVETNKKNLSYMALAYSANAEDADTDASMGAGEKKGGEDEDEDEEELGNGKLGLRDIGTYSKYIDKVLSDDSPRFFADLNDCSWEVMEPLQPAVVKADAGAAKEVEFNPKSMMNHWERRRLQALPPQIREEAEIAWKEAMKKATMQYETLKTAFTPVLVDLKRRELKKILDAMTARGANDGKGDGERMDDESEHSMSKK